MLPPNPPHVHLPNSGSPKPKREPSAGSELGKGAESSSAASGELSSGSGSGGVKLVTTRRALMQPVSGWADAERKLFGNSKTDAGKTPQSKRYYNKKKKEAEKEKAVAQKAYGTIYRYLAPSFPSGREGAEESLKTSGSQ